MFILYVIAGIFSGILGGMGMGGGTILIPVLSLFFGVNQHIAQAINLFSFIPMSVVAVILHSKNKLIKFKVVLPIILAGVVSCVLGSICAELFQKELLRKFFGGFLILVALISLIFTFKKTNKN